MAKSKKNLAVAEGDDLFAAATAKKKAQPKKPAGTSFQLPKELDAAGNMTPECSALHEAVTEIIKAKEEEDKAKNRGNTARSLVRPLVESQYAAKIATSGALPVAPVVVVNHRGESLTYVIQNRSDSKGLSDEQIEMLKDMIGEDAFDRITVEYRNYSFNPDTMLEIAGEVPVGISFEEATELPRVHNIVAKRVSAALAAAVESGEITAEQRANLLSADVKTKLRPGEFEKIAQYTGADVSRVQGVLEALDGVIIRYLKS